MSEAMTQSPALLLRLPPEWEAALSADAIKQGCTQQSIILTLLASHYGITAAPPRQGGYRRKAATKKPKK